MAGRTLTTDRSPRPANKSLAHTLPYESFVGAVIGGFFNLKGLVRTEASYEVYAAEFIPNSDDRFIAKAYSLRGISGKERNIRVKDLKRNAHKASLVGSLEQRRKKWLDFHSSSIAKTEIPEQYQPTWQSRSDYECTFPTLTKEQPLHLCNSKSENTFQILCVLPKKYIQYFSIWCES